MIDRTRREPDPFLDWKIRIFFAGALLMGAGVVLGRDVLVLLAILVLIAGLFTTLILGKRQERARRMEVEAGEDEDPHPLA